jgi:hypothetical protein
VVLQTLVFLAAFSSRPSTACWRRARRRGSRGGAMMTALIDLIAVPFQLPVHAAALIVARCWSARACAVLSCYLVLKGWSLMGDAISHAVLPGIVLAYVLGLPLAIGAFAAGCSARCSPAT